MSNGLEALNVTEIGDGFVAAMTAKCSLISALP